MRAWSPLVAIVFTAGCAATPPQPAAFRLDATLATPSAQTIRLQLDPTDEAYHGTTTIHFDLHRRSQVVWLHARDLELIEAVLVGPSGNVQVEVVNAPEHEQVGLLAATQLPAGTYRAEFSFAGRVADGNTGLMVRRSGDAAYLATQFQSHSARSVFPCFDEPRFRVRWALEVTAPEGMAILGNMPEAASRRNGTWQTVSFVETPPLPSYLVAFGVGPYEIVDAGAVGRNRIPMRFAMTAGGAERIAHAMPLTAELITALEDYFDMPLPFPKLDQLEIPDWGGAMENPGLITYAANTLRADSQRQRQFYGMLAAHELAHFWFGDLVTPVWWDDIWLNESFAVWLSYKVAAQVRPEWGYPEEFVAFIDPARETDSLPSATAARAPVESGSDINASFNAITYAKGAGLLAMAEKWSGPDSLREAIRAHIRAHAWGIASSEDFFDSLDRHGRAKTGTILRAFTGNAGIPEVELEVRCDRGAPSVTVAQRRYARVGSPPLPAQTWPIPVCIAHGDGNSERGETCALVDDSEATFALASSVCPAWWYGNADASGYYQVAYPPAQLRALAEHHSFLSANERLRLVSDLDAAMAAGRLRFTDLEPMLSSFAGDPEPSVAFAFEKLTARALTVAPAARRDGMRASIAAAAKPAFAAVGWDPRAEESPRHARRRALLLWIAGLLGRDSEIGAEAVRRVQAVFAGQRDAISADIRYATFAIAAAHNGAAVADLFEQAARNPEVDEATRRAAAFALGTSGPAQLDRIYSLALDPTMPRGASMFALMGAGYDAATSSALWQRVASEPSAIVERFDSGGLFNTATRLPTLLGRTFCSEREGEELSALLGPLLAEIEGAPHALEQMVERIRFCAAERTASYG